MSVETAGATAPATIQGGTGSSGPFTEAQREHLRAQVTLAAEAIPLNWPMRTFISRSPLMGFEHLPFEEAVAQAKALFGGEAYLSVEEYQTAYAAGRITQGDLLEALHAFDPSLRSLDPLRIQDRTIEPEQVILLHLLHGIDPVPAQSLSWKIGHELVTRLLRPDTPESTCRHLLSQAVERVRRAQESVGRSDTIAEWVRSVTMVDLPAAILDSIAPQGQHTQPDGEGGVTAEDLGRMVRALGLPASRRDGYAACVERRHQNLEASHPARRLAPRRFAALWMERERRFLNGEALRHFGVCGRFGPVSREAERDPLGYYVQSLWYAATQVLEQQDRRTAPEAPRAESGRGTASESLDGPAGSPVATFLNDQLVKWVAAFVDEGMADWAMPSRARGFYAAWRDLAPRDGSLRMLGISSGARKIESLPAQPEDALISLLRRLEVPEKQWSDYLRHHLAALPGWAGYIRWRGQNPDYPEQARHPIDLVDYLAVRLFYEVELAETPSPRPAGPPGTQPSREHDPGGTTARHAWRLFHLAQLLEMTPEELRRLSSDQAWTMLAWLDRLNREASRRVWHEAYEGRYRQDLLAKLAGGADRAPRPRPRGQAVFCIDVRSEPFRRHFEGQGGYETIGFAGFFAVPLCYRPLGQEQELLLCPVLIRPKHLATEGPRLGQDRRMQARLMGERWHQAGEHLVHDLKASPLPSHQTIDLLGIPFGLSLAAKTLAVDTYRRLRHWLRRWLRPPVPTRIPIEKFSEEQGDAIIAVGERALIAEVFERRFTRDLRDRALSPAAIEEFRLAAIRPQPRGVAQRTAPARATEASVRLGLSVEEEQALLHELRVHYGVSAPSRQAQLDRLSARGFTPKEQAFMVETALRLMSLTANFARLVLICGHGSSTENNPYASALDCGACGGNHGGPNARVLASMANKAEVRAELRGRGIDIPDDTRFLAGQHDTTTDRVSLFDVEELPETHRPDWLQLQWDLEAAGLQTARERCRRLPGAPRGGPLRAAARHVRRRSADWAQVRPEWGLSNNAAFVIGRRALTRQLNLGGRTFLHNYDAAADETGKILETIMTAPLVVAEWINLQYYFSSVDPWVYGSGTKVLHNVVGGMGVMLGRHSDLQTGLPLQTVNDGPRHYHEPQRLLAVVEAGQDRLSGIIAGHEILQRFFDHRWVHLVAVDPGAGTLAQYRPGGGWASLSPARRREGSRP